MRDPLNIPPFLHRKPSRRKPPPVVETGGSAAREDKPLERVQLTEFVRLAETAAEEAGFAMGRGVLPRRWYSGNPESEEVVRLHLQMSDRALRDERRAERDARPERVHKYAGLVSMEDVLSAFHPKPDLATAKAAVRAARLEHERWHFAPELLQTARNVIRDYKPGETRRARKSEFSPTARIAWRGKNPKREGSEAHARWELVRQHDKRTVAEFLAGGGNPTTLKNAISRKHVKLGDEDGDTGGESREPIQREAGADVRPSSEEAGAVASREQDRGGDAEDRKKRRARAGRSRRNR